jgi:hypothetical protein
VVTLGVAATVAVTAASFTESSRGGERVVSIDTYFIHQSLDQQLDAAHRSQAEEANVVAHPSALQSAVSPQA